MPAEIIKNTVTNQSKIKFQHMIKYIFNCQTIAVLFVLSLCWFSFKQANIFNKKIEHHLSAEQLFEEFTLNNTKAQAKYLNKELYISGKVQQVIEKNTGEIILYLGPSKVLSYLRCSLSAEKFDLNKEIKEGMWVGITGLCKGYKTNVDLEECKLVNP